MSSEFLSICIPTRNRSFWLKKALLRLLAEIKANKIEPDILKIYISDNCSTDDTPAMIKNFCAQMPHLIYSRNPVNIGADPNILKCCRSGEGEYRWVMGDDDALYPEVLGYIFKCLREMRPALFINNDGRSAHGFTTPVLFGSYREFSQICMQANPHMLLAHSLISANIFHADLFNHDFANAMVGTNYGHMYGMVEALSKKSGGVFVTDRQTIVVRNSSLDPIDGIWPSDMYKIWGDYLDWVKNQYGLNNLNRDSISDYIRRAVFLEFKEHPIKTVWHYGKNINRAQTWKSFLKIVRKK